MSRAAQPWSATRGTGPLPQLLSTQDVPGAEEGDAREPQVLVQHEHAHGDEVGVTQVVNEAADVAIVAGIDAIHLPILERAEGAFVGLTARQRCSKASHWVLLKSC